MARIDPHSYFDDRQPRMRHLRLALRVDFCEKRLEGTAVLGLEPTRSRCLDLDTRDLTILDVSSEGRPLAWELGEEDPILGQRLRLEVPPGCAEVVVSYQTSPKATGLQWLDPEQTGGKGHPFLFTQSQAIHARSWVPCQDCAVARVVYEAEVAVPAGLTAVMSAHALGREGDLFRFRMSQPIPTYLLALAVGELASRELGPRSRVWGEPGMVDRAAWEFAEVEAMIQKAEALFGPYDWERYDMLVLPPSFPYGGMENPRMTFLTPTLLAGDRSLVDVVAHELAHSWTGNRVTNATAEHFWLNEGFTVWAERRILRALRGEEAESLAWAVGERELAESLERFRDRPELTRLRTHLDGVDPDEAFSSIPYEKGARFVWVLEQAMGTEAFSRFLRAYLDRFRFTSITTEAFCAFLETWHPGLLAQVGGEVWLQAPGMPAQRPCFQSARLEELVALAQGWPEGQRPPEQARDGWNTRELLVYLQHLPGILPEGDCAWLDEHLELTARGNCEIATAWLVLAIRSGYLAVLPRVRTLLREVGRMKFLRPLYTALQEGAQTRDLAREIFEEAKPGYHPLSRRVVEEVLATA